MHLQEERERERERERGGGGGGRREGGRDSSLSKGWSGGMARVGGVNVLSFGVVVSRSLSVRPTSGVGGVLVGTP